ncbi:hypothetical protein E5678_18595 [Hydrogenophaga sp. PAMC20947]|nr:hypothetical protein E5678_18595 [Hydrogenophaga sp. PAMC20947]
MPMLLQCVCGAPAPLWPAELLPGLPVQACETCHGSLVSLDDYRQWLEGRPESPQPEPSDRPVTTHSTPARACPRCTRLMERLRVSHEPDFRLDRCVGCQCVWLDAGEWPALVDAGLALRLNEVLADGWQRRVREEVVHHRREDELRARHGDACVDDLIRIRAWLHSQPAAQRETLLLLLRSGW